MMMILYSQDIRLYYLDGVLEVQVTSMSCKRRIALGSLDMASIMGACLDYHAKAALRLFLLYLSLFLRGFKRFAAAFCCCCNSLRLALALLLFLLVLLGSGSLTFCEGGAPVSLSSKTRSCNPKIINYTKLHCYLAYKP